MIPTCVNLIDGPSPETDRFLGRFALPQVPAVNDLLSLPTGNPYVVRERTWAIDEQDVVTAYLRVSVLWEGR